MTGNKHKTGLGYTALIGVPRITLALKRLKKTPNLVNIYVKVSMLGCYFAGDWIRCFLLQLFLYAS